jgi:hypothetical protein
MRQGHTRDKTHAGKAARLTLVLQHEYERLVPSDTRARDMLKHKLEESVAVLTLLDLLVQKHKY